MFTEPIDDALPGNPYHRFRQLPEPQRRQLLSDDLEHKERSADWHMSEGSIWTSLTRLGWDSSHLGVNVGRIDIVCGSNVAASTLQDISGRLCDAIAGAGLQYVRARVVDGDLH